MAYRSLAKLDSYDYELGFGGKYGHMMIRIPVDGPEDITVADLSTSITASDGHIYVEGHYFGFDEMRVHEINGQYYVDIHVHEEGELAHA